MQSNDFAHNKLVEDDARVVTLSGVEVLSTKAEPPIIKLANSSIGIQPVYLDLLKILF